LEQDEVLVGESQEDNAIAISLEIIEKCFYLIRKQRVMQ